MWTSPMIQLDLSRRRVAAISFLSNISVEDDPKSEEDNLHCLKVLYNTLEKHQKREEM